MENIKSEIEAISAKTGVPIRYIENAIKESQDNYNRSNSMNVYVIYTQPRSTSS